MRHDQLKQQTNVLLAIVTRGSGASPGDGCRVETPANDRQTEHAVRGGVTKLNSFDRHTFFK